MDLEVDIVKQIAVSAWDELVKATYGRPYSFQQQDGYKARGIELIDVPSDEYDFENDTIPEEVNGEEMGVSLKAWLARDPKQKLRDEGGASSPDYLIDLWWERNFYPTVNAIINDLHSKGLLDEGEYQIVIDW